MKRFILDNNGAVVAVLNGTADIVMLNTPENAIYIEGDYEASVSDYWNGVSFFKIGDAPNDYSKFDYSIKQWIDTRTLDEIKSQKWAEIKSQRDELEFGGFEFEGHRYDSDIKAQGRITAAAQLGVPVEWTLQDNTTVWLEPDDQQRLVQTLAMHITSVHARGKIAREKIYNATTIAEVEAVKL